MREITDTELGVALCNWLEQQPGKPGVKASALLKLLSAMIGCAAKDEDMLLEGLQLAIDDLRSNAAEVFINVQKARAKAREQT